MEVTVEGGAVQCHGWLASDVRWVLVPRTFQFPLKILTLKKLPSPLAFSLSLRHVTVSSAGSHISVVGLCLGIPWYGSFIPLKTRMLPGGARSSG